MKFIEISCQAEKAVHGLGSWLWRSRLSFRSPVRGAFEAYVARESSLAVTDSILRYKLSKLLF